MVGLIRGVRGLRGQVRVEVLTDDPEGRFGAGAVLFREGSATAEDQVTVSGSLEPSRWSTEPTA